ncbi:MAG: 6-carboxytetrahydropterin synthase [Bacteroidia bacterium]|nr:6-carboxytetrahydropterin synthase [Bacteroidia bacterium]
MVFVTRQVHFNAAHKMVNPAWSAEQNQAVFGPCANENWHGHNYVLEVTLAGEPDPDTGYVFDLAKLKTILDERVLRHLDHKNLNLDVPFLQGIIPSSENLAIAIWQQLLPAVAPAQLYSVRLYETPRNFVEYRG